MKIGSKTIGDGEPVFVVAELSGNHGGNLERALATIRAAAEAGADAIKFQTYTADTLTIDERSPDFIVPGGAPWGGRSLYDLYSEAFTPWEWHGDLFAEGRRLGLEVFSTPFDETAVDFLEKLDPPAYKIASFELVDDQLLQTVARTRRPVILSRGMASLSELDRAVTVLREGGTNDIALLHCVSSYPAPARSMNLSTIPSLRDVFRVPVGLSDHSLGATAAIAAVSLGASVIEKHFILSRSDGGVDSHFSIEPEEFREMVRAIREATEMVGIPTFGPSRADRNNTRYRRSLYVVTDIRRGEVLSPENVRSIRPGFGLPPAVRTMVLGRKAAVDIARGTPLSWDLIAP
jgi:pseudaminic acid synthase